MMKKTYFVYSETKYAVTVDVPDGSTPEEIEAIVSEKFYRDDVEYGETLDGYSDIEDEDGNSIMKSNDVYVVVCVTDPPESITCRGMYGEWDEAVKALYKSYVSSYKAAVEKWKEWDEDSTYEENYCAMKTFYGFSTEMKIDGEVMIPWVCNESGIAYAMIYRIVETSLMHGVGKRK